MSRSFDPYASLGVNRRADDDEIKRAYFEGVRRYPPEKDPERFKEIRAAYERIKSADKRAQTDLFLLQPPPGPPKRRRRGGGYDLSVRNEDVFTLAFELAAVELAWHKEFREPELP